MTTVFTPHPRAALTRTLSYTDEARKRLELEERLTAAEAALKAHG